MLTAPVRPHRAPPVPARALVPVPTSSRPVRLEIRQRRATVVLAVALAGTLLGASVTRSGALWLSTMAVAAVTVAYLALVARVRGLNAEREMATAFAVDTTLDWDAFGFGLLDAAGGGEGAADGAEGAAVGACGATVPPATVAMGHGDLVRFVAAWALGVVLTPIVGLVRIAGGDLSDLERHGVIDKLVRAQAYGRSQSLRVVAAGLVATAGVTAVGVLAPNGSAYAAATVASSATSAHYVVRSGDTLGSIAARFGVSVSSVAAANDIADADLIFPGQVLVIPGAGPGSGAGSSGGSPAASGATTYTVVAGDTLGAIAARFGTTVAALASLNHIADPNVIFVGERLVVGGSSSSSGRPGGGTPTPGGESAAAAEAVRVALAQVGKPYVYGGAGPASFDCSGLVMYAYAAAGVSLPHYTVSQYDDTTRVSEAQLLAGDLVFYDNYSGPQPGHVAIYIGNGQVVSANTTGTDVQTQSITWDGTIMGFGRVG